MHCTVTFHDLVIRHADMVLTHGVMPSVCHVLAVPSLVPSGPGLLSFVEDTGNVVEFHDAAINRATLKPVETATGIRMVIQIQDRRWRWKYCRVSGVYNQLRRDGDYQEETKKTYRELLEILLDALNEEHYEIEMPDDTLVGIPVTWCHARADLELAKLLDKIGCIVSLGLDNRVRILTNGQGPIYADTSREKMPLVETVPSTLPRQVTVLFAPTKIQCPVLLEAVGLEYDSREITFIEDPGHPNAWENSAPDWYPEILDAQRRQLARRSIFKWYRVHSIDVDEVELPDGPTIGAALDVERILPLDERLLEHPSEHLALPNKAYLKGIWWQGDLAGKDNEEAVDTDHFTLDGERGMIYLDHPLMMVDAEQHDVPRAAEPYLVCTFSVRVEETNEYHCYRYTMDTGIESDRDAGEAVVTVPDVFLSYRYDDVDQTWVDNKVNVDDYAEKLAEAFLNSFKNIPQAEQEWVGLTSFSVAGNVHMMRWLVSADRCLTYGYKNVESSLIAPTHHERRMREITEGVLP